MADEYLTELTRLSNLVMLLLPYQQVYKKHYQASRLKDRRKRTAKDFGDDERECLNGWHGGNFKNSKPGRPIKDIHDF